MPTNDERREVAARLRYVAEHGAPEWATIACCIAECLGEADYPLWRSGGDKLFDRLADLIEPEPERTCHKELMTTEDYRGTEVEYFGCSWCGEYLSGTDCYGLDDGPNYCSNCGHKVDKSIVTDECTGEVIYRDGAKVVE